MIDNIICIDRKNRINRFTLERVVVEKAVKRGKATWLGPNVAKYFDREWNAYQASRNYRLDHRNNCIILDDLAYCLSQGLDEKMLQDLERHSLQSLKLYFHDVTNK